MKRNIDESGFDLFHRQSLKNNPVLAHEYAKQFVKLPLSVQLGLLRRDRWLSQKAVARKLKTKQPHVARLENPRHDPRVSSLEKMARALDYRLMLVPEKTAAKVAEFVCDAKYYAEPCRGGETKAASGTRPAVR